MGGVCSTSSSGGLHDRFIERQANFGQERTHALGRLTRRRTFNFLDHALKCGDSLLGLSSLEQLQTFSLRKEAGRQGLILQFLHQEVEQAIDKRRRLESLPSDSLPQLIEKEALHRDAEDLTAKLRCAADMLIAAELTNGANAKKDEARLQAHFAVVRHYHHEPLPLVVRFDEEAVLIVFSDFSPVSDAEIIHISLRLSIGLEFSPELSAGSVHVAAEPAADRDVDPFLFKYLYESAHMSLG